MKAVIFDLDGTLIESAGDLQAAANRLMRHKGLAEFDLATVIGFIGHGIPRLVERCFAHNGVRPDDLAGEVARFKDFYAQENHRRTRLMPGVEAVLRRLDARGLALGICTNKDVEPTHAILDRLRIADLFRAVVGGDSGLGKKPDGAPLLHCVALCDAQPGEAVYVGDSETDATTAESAGLPFLLYSEGYRHVPVAAMRHAAAFRDFAALPGLIAEVAGSRRYSTPAPASPS